MTEPDLIAVSVLVLGALGAGLGPWVLQAARRRALADLAERAELRFIVPFARKCHARRQGDRLISFLSALPSPKLVELGEEATRSQDPNAQLVFVAVYQILTGRRRTHRQAIRLSRAWQHLRDDVTSLPW